MEVREGQAQKDDAAHDERRSVLHRNLRSIFAAADKDGSGTLERDEYMELLKSPFHKEKIQDISRMPVQDLAMMFEWLDVDGNGEIDFKEFLHGFDWLNEPITGKSLLKIGHAARSRLSTLRGSVDDLRNNVTGLRLRQEAHRKELLETLQDVLAARRRLSEADQRWHDAGLAIASAEEQLHTARNSLRSEIFAGDPAASPEMFATEPLPKLVTSPSRNRS